MTALDWTVLKICFWLAAYLAYIAFMEVSTGRLGERLDRIEREVERRQRLGIPLCGKTGNGQ